MMNKKDSFIILQFSYTYIFSYINRYLELEKLEKKLFVYNIFLVNITR